MAGKDRYRVEKARRFMRLLDRDPLHAEQVRFIAMLLFDGLNKVHRLGDRHRDCLEAAALLHDIGYARGSSGHHKHSALIILERGIEGFSGAETRIIALTARYHRKGGPKKTHDEFISLPRAERSTVEKLSALLQVADGLDRSHTAAVLDLSVSANKSYVHLAITAGTPVTVELEAMEKKAILFHEVYGKYIRVAVRAPS